MKFPAPTRGAIALFTAAAFALAACGSDDDAAETTDAPAAATDDTVAEAETIELDIGFIPGPYADMFKGGIAPILEAQGIEANIDEISDFTIPNQATVDGDLDMTIFQNDAFMDGYNAANGSDIVSILKIPSAPLGMYAGKGSATSPADIEDGATLALTSEASNLARSLNFLETLGLVEVGEVPEGEFATEKDLTSNPKNLKFELVDAPQVPRTLPDVDYGVALGNHIYAADGVTLGDAIALEDVPEASQITVTVLAENAESAGAQAVVAAFESDEFRAFVENDPNFASFVKPSWWK
ncbi:MetQ/NlpA family ABC transporter substrate-binding protein [Ilumatobacter coccineus]|uniref:Methionine ABC transporter substrate-binding protein n=1 Tax=Ilumatobacter coccineus (strain NBRC 103263 / KCTC 29153 / YM16-304) TaxID=1313172 RepID=A0A6C7EJZ6_ILUCY|nr:MetQ/NlpA family ABC transporter substrate-binding protein [Ilumatobacter coccineus]BAN04276.1 methionine ABC transporter substrate-binding protein [Ilumatobacter coccineus YM16-304]